MAALSSSCAAAVVGLQEPVNRPPMQRWAEDVAGQPVPEPARSRAAFEGITRAMRFRDVLLRVGAPAEELASAGPGSAFVWDLERGEQVIIGTPDLEHVEFVDLQTRNGKRVRLLSQ